MVDNICCKLLFY